jgi:flagellar motility protein MotE (MotC chaperone)
MPLRLSTTDVAEALAGLSPEERAELLALLETRERLRPEMPHDDREPIEDIVKRMNAETAAASVDPEAWYAAHEVHQRLLPRASGQIAGN